MAYKDFRALDYSEVKSKISHWYVILVKTPKKGVGAVMRFGSAGPVKEDEIRDAVSDQLRAQDYRGPAIVELISCPNEEMSQFLYNAIDGTKMSDAQIERICAEARKRKSGMDVFNMRTEQHKAN